jgi:hypothetical protein
VRRIVSFGRFWWNFVVGDDWRAAAGIVVAIGITAAVGSWWFLPPAIAVVLALSLWREARDSARSP